MSRFFDILFLMIALWITTLATATRAEDPAGPVGPKAPTTVDEEGGTESKPVEVDLPYKPSIPQPPKDDLEDDDPPVRPPPPPPEPVIPYIPSKSPDPVGAPDPF